MAGTILGAMRTATIDGLAALVDPAPRWDEIAIKYQFRLDPSVREWIFTSNARATHAPASLRAGRNYRDETGRFEVAIVVETVGDTDHQEAADRAVEIGTVVEEFIADRKSDELGVPGLLTCIVDGDLELAEFSKDSGCVATLTIPVKYTARIT